MNPFFKMAQLRLVHFNFCKHCLKNYTKVIIEQEAENGEKGIDKTR